MSELQLRCVIFQVYVEKASCFHCFSFLIILFVVYTVRDSAIFEEKRRFFEGVRVHAAGYIQNINDGSVRNHE